MAELTNGKTGALRLAAQVDVLRSEEQGGPIVRGPVFTFGSGDDMCWLRVTFWVGEHAIFEQDVMVQWASIRNWPHDLAQMRQTHKGSGSFGFESPELFIEVEETYLEPTIRFKPEDDYGYELLIGVDTGISAGASGVSGKGPLMRFYPGYAAIERFALDLKAEARFVRMLEELDVAELDYEALRQEWAWFTDALTAPDEDDWSI